MIRRHRLALLAGCLLLPLASRADDEDDDDEHERKHTREHAREHARVSQRDRRARVAAMRSGPEWKSYLAECGSCHLAFPPSMLPARSWEALLSGLKDHFGENAELESATLTRLETFLTANAGREVPGPTPLRITTLPWWREEHDELAPAVYARKAVLTPANCGACHPGANQGAFNEDAVKIPRDAPPPR